MKVQLESLYNEYLVHVKSSNPQWYYLKFVKSLNELFANIRVADYSNSPVDVQFNRFVIKKDSIGSLTREEYLNALNKSLATADALARDMNGSNPDLANNIYARSHELYEKYLKLGDDETYSAYYNDFVDQLNTIFIDSVMSKDKYSSSYSMFDRKVSYQNYSFVVQGVKNINDYEFKRLSKQLYDNAVKLINNAFYSEAQKIKTYINCLDVLFERYSNSSVAIGFKDYSFYYDLLVKEVNKLINTEYESLFSVYLEPHAFDESVINLYDYTFNIPEFAYVSPDIGKILVFEMNSLRNIDAGVYNNIVNVFFGGVNPIEWVNAKENEIHNLTMLHDLFVNVYMDIFISLGQFRDNYKLYVNQHDFILNISKNLQNPLEYSVLLSSEDGVVLYSHILEQIKINLNYVLGRNSDALNRSFVENFSSLGYPPSENLIKLIDFFNRMKVEGFFNPNVFNRFDFVENARFLSSGKIGDMIYNDLLTYYSTLKPNSLELIMGAFKILGVNTLNVDFPFLLFKEAKFNINSLIKNNKRDELISIYRSISAMYQFNMMPRDSFLISFNVNLVEYLDSKYRDLIAGAYLDVIRAKFTNQFSDFDTLLNQIDNDTKRLKNLINIYKLYHDKDNLDLVQIKTLLGVDAEDYGLNAENTLILKDVISIMSNVGANLGWESFYNSWSTVQVKYPEIGNAILKNLASLLFNHNLKIGLVSYSEIPNFLHLGVYGSSRSYYDVFGESLRRMIIDFSKEYLHNQENGIDPNIVPNTNLDGRYDFVFNVPNRVYQNGSDL